MGIKLKSLEEVLNEEEIQEGVRADILKALKGKKTSVGVPVDESFQKYLDALVIVAMQPSMIKPYLEEDGIEFPAKKEVNAAIDACNKVLSKIK